MLEITIPATELYDEDTSSFITIKQTTLRLEHSLVSISKWEAKWKKPFLTNEDKTVAQSRDYVRCMTLNQNIDPEVYYGLTSKNFSDVNTYMETEQTATWFSNLNEPPSREVITSELIYYWMVAYQIPWEAQKWHLSRLLTLIKICNIKNAPPKKMSKQQILRQNHSLNAARRAKLHSKG